MIDDLTFSTYEAPHRNIRDYTLADVVGTYFGSPDKGLALELGTSRGIALDTFSEARSSPELRGNVWDALPLGVNALFDLAANGEWELLPAVRRAVGRDERGLFRASEALARARVNDAEVSNPVGPTAPDAPGATTLIPGAPYEVVEIAVVDWGTNPLTPPNRVPPVPEEANPGPDTQSEFFNVPDPTPDRTVTNARARRARNQFLFKAAALVVLLLATGGTIAATIKFWPWTVPTEVVKNNPAHPAAPDSSDRQPAPKDPNTGPSPVTAPPKIVPPTNPPSPELFPSAGLRAGQAFEWEIAPGVKMVFCWVPPGRCQLGAPADEQAVVTPGGKPQKWVDAESVAHRPNYSTAGLWLGKYEVTQAEWWAVMGNNPSTFNGANTNAAKGSDTARFPVENVSWHDCQNFVRKLNERAVATSLISGIRPVFVLPHKDEWEYACRGALGIDRPFHFGKMLNGTQANVDGTTPWGKSGEGAKLGRTTTVGSYEKEHPHPWNLCDMHGNAAEWCENRYEPGEDTRVLRGGHWSGHAWECRSAARAHSAPTAHTDTGGFRVCFRPAMGVAHFEHLAGIASQGGLRPPVTIPKKEKHTLPTDDAVIVARDRLRDSFKSEYAKLAPNTAAEIAAKLLATAQNEKPGSAMHYVICAESMLLFEKAGRLSGVIDSACLIQNAYFAPRLTDELATSLAQILGDKNKDGEFKTIAAMELEQPANSAALVALGRGWLATLKTCRANTREQVARHARRIILEGLAFPDLKGLNKTNAEISLQIANVEIETSDAKYNKFTLYSGKWILKYGNKVTHEYIVENDGTVMCSRKFAPDGKQYVEKDQMRAKLVRRDGAVTASFAQGQIIERFEVRGDTLFVERFEPAKLYPKKPSQKAEGVRRDMK